MSSSIKNDPRDSSGSFQKQGFTPKLSAACLGMLIVWNIASFMISDNGANPAVSFPAPGLRNGYMQYISAEKPSEHDFYLYESLRQAFPNGHLIGFNQTAIAFGTHSFGGLSTQSVIAYDPALTDEEILALSQQVIMRRRQHEGIAANVIVAPTPPKEDDTIIVLTGPSGERFFVSGSLAPARYARIAHAH